jgi:hypothetical protein
MRFISALSIIWIFSTWGFAQEQSLSPAISIPTYHGQDAYTPVAAWGQDSYLLVWQSGRLGEGDLTKEVKFVADLVGCRVSRDGKILDAEPFVVCKADDAQEAPDIAFNGEVFLVVWQDLRNVKDWDVYATRISPDGKVLDPDGFLISGGRRSQAQPRVAWDGKSFVVAWQDLHSEQFYEVFATRVSGEGKVLDSEPIKVVSIPEAHAYAPAIASLGGGVSLITWASNKHGFGTLQCSGAHLLTDGMAAQCYAFEADRWYKDGRRIGPIRACVPTCLVAGKDNYLWSWTSMAPIGRGNASPKDNVAVFDRRGKRLTYTMTLSGHDHHVIAPQAAWTGNGYLAAWTELVRPQRMGTFPHDEVFAACIDANGVSAGAIPVAGSQEAPARGVAVASDGQGHALVAYEQHPADANVPITITVRTWAAK